MRWSAITAPLLAGALCVIGAAPAGAQDPDIVTADGADFEQRLGVVVFEIGHGKPDIAEFGERFSRPLLSDGVATGRVWSFRDISPTPDAEEEREKSLRGNAPRPSL